MKNAVFHFEKFIGIGKGRKRNERTMARAIKVDGLPRCEWNGWFLLDNAGNTRRIIAGKAGESEGREIHYRLMLSLTNYHRWPLCALVEIIQCSLNASRHAKRPNLEPNLAHPVHSLSPNQRHPLSRPPKTFRFPKIDSYFPFFPAFTLCSGLWNEKLPYGNKGSNFI